MADEIRTKKNGESLLSLVKTIIPIVSAQAHLFIDWPINYSISCYQSILSQIISSFFVQVLGINIDFTINLI